METLVQDVRYSIRILLKNRLLTVAAVLSMALGIGANTAVFSAVNAVLLKSLPYKEVSHLVLVWGQKKENGALDDRNQVSATDVADYRAQNTVFEDIATYTGWVPILSGQGEAERIPAIQVGDGYFKVMKGKAMLGRTFLPEEQNDGKDFVIVLGHGLWQRKFGSDPNIIGRKILLNAKPYTIVGVMPPDFQPLPTSLVTPEGQFYRPVAEEIGDTHRDERHLRSIARLKPGVTLAQAQSQLKLIARRIEQQYPDTDTGVSTNIVPITEDTVGGIRRSLWILFGAVTFVLLIACANISNLLLAQSAVRQREITVRAALGASRWRLARQLMTESLILSLTGGILGFFVAYCGTSLIAAAAKQIHPLLGMMTTDMRVLAFTFVLSIAAGLMFGLAPSWHISHTELTNTLKSNGQNAPSTSPFTSRLRGMLIVSEVAITLILLVCAGLFLQTVMRLRQVDTGFNPRRVLTMTIGLPMARYPEKPDWISFYNRMLARLSAIPGVKTAAITSVLPLSNNFDGRGIIIEDHPMPPGQGLSVDLYVVTPDYLRTMETPVIRGRGITDQDRADSFQVALINETMARRLWNGRDALGKRIRFESDKNRWRTIVGVVKDVQQYALDQTPPMQFYLPYKQFPTLFNSIVIKTVADPLSVVSEVRNVIHSLDPEEAVFQITTMEELLASSIAMRRLLMNLLLSLSFLALLMASIGIYGLMSYTVAQKTREIGIRMALGAGRPVIFRLIVRQAMMLTVIGVVAGAAGAAGATRVISGLLFQTNAADPRWFSAVSILLTAVALAACLLPARRAAAMDPVAAIRDE